MFIVNILINISRKPLVNKNSLKSRTKIRPKQSVKTKAPPKKLADRLRKKRAIARASKRNLLQNKFERLQAKKARDESAMKRHRALI
jgi:hypothetical protein